MRSFYILIPTLAIANMGGANAQLQKSGAENIRSGVIQRAIAVTEKRQIHSADFSSGGPSPDGGFVDPLRSNHGRKDARHAADEKLLANRGLLSGLTSGFQNIFGLGAGSSSQGTANADAAAGTTATAGDASSGSLSGVVDSLGTVSLNGLIDTTLGTAGQSGDNASSNDTLSLGVNLPVAGQVGASGSGNDVLSLDVNLPVAVQVGDNSSSGGAALNSADQLGLALVGVAPAGSGTITGQESATGVIAANPIAQIGQSASESVAGALNIVGADTLLLGISGAGTQAVQNPAPIAPNSTNAPPSRVQSNPNQAASVQVVNVNSASVSLSARPSASATLSVAISGAASQAVQATARPASTAAGNTSTPPSRVQTNQLAVANAPARASVSAAARPSASGTLSVGVAGVASQTIRASARPVPTTANTTSAPRVQVPASPPRQPITAQGSSEIDSQTAQLISAALGSSSGSASTTPNVAQSSSVSSQQVPAAQVGGSSNNGVAVIATPSGSGTSSLSASQFSSPNAFPAGVSSLAGGASAQAAQASAIATNAGQSSSQASTTPFQIAGLFVNSNGELVYSEGGSTIAITSVPDLPVGGSSSPSASSVVQGVANLGDSTGASASPQALGNAVGSGSISSTVQGLANLGESAGASSSPQASGNVVGSGSVSSAVQGLGSLGQSAGASSGPQASGTIAGSGSGSGSVSAVAQEVANVEDTITASVGAGVQAAANIAAQAGETVNAAISDVSALNMSGAASLQSDVSAQLNALD